jgi:hypothetical protein
VKRLEQALETTVRFECSREEIGYFEGEEMDA